MTSETPQAWHSAISLKSPSRTWLLGAVILLSVVTVNAQPVIKVAAGSCHTLFLKSDGSLWGMGDNRYGQLGNGTNGAANFPEQILASNVTAIAAGGYHTLFLKSDGSLWAMGNDQYGQLGDGIYATNSPFFGTNLPELIVASNVTAIAAGGLYSLFLKSDGSLWAMGKNEHGQLGDGTYNSNNLPEQIVASNVTAIAAGAAHSLFLKNDGSLWGMGNDYYGQLGDGKNSYTTILPEQIVASNVTAIAAGNGHSLFLKNDGSLWAMGEDIYGQLGDGRYADTWPDDGTNLPEQIVASNVTAIATGSEHSLFLKSDGSLWAMGWNLDGQLGNGSYSMTNLPDQISAGNVVAIAANSYFSLFLKSDGSLWGMGYNLYGQFGDGGLILYTNSPQQLITGPLGYNEISIQLLSGNNVRLSFWGISGAKYALDWSAGLSPNWTPKVTNSAGAGGMLVFTNTSDPIVNNFWRVRSVP